MKPELERKYGQFFDELEAELETKQGKVKCASCRHLPKVQPKNPLGDYYCPVSDKTLVGGGNNNRTFSQPRICPQFEKEV